MVDETASSTSKVTSLNRENEASASKGDNNHLNNNNFVYVMNKKRRNSNSKIVEIRRSNKIARINKRKDVDEDLLTGKLYELLFDTGENSDMEVGDRYSKINEKQEQSGRQNRQPPIAIHGKPTAEKHIKLIQLLDEGVSQRKYRA